MDTKHYGIVDEIITNEGSGVANLSVTALLGASENYPEARIVIGSTAAAGADGTDGFAISVRKWREFAALVDAACADITAACPAHGDAPRPSARPGMTGRPQALRAYLTERWRDLNTRVLLRAGQSQLADEAEKVGEFIRWMDEAGLGK